MLDIYKQIGLNSLKKSKLLKTKLEEINVD